MTKIFDTSTIEGLKKAERFQNRMYSKYESVNVYPIGLNRVQIVALRPIEGEEDGWARAKKTWEPLDRGGVRIRVERGREHTMKDYSADALAQEGTR